MYKIRKMEIGDTFKYYLVRRRKLLSLFGYWDHVMDGRPGAHPLFLGGELRMFDTEEDAKEYINQVTYEKEV